MKKLVAVISFAVMVFNFTSANADERYAYEYSSDDDDDGYERHRRRDNDSREYQREEWYENRNYQKYPFQTPRYQQNYRQAPIQIYIPQPPNFLRHEDKEFREERLWRERRRELERSQQTPYFENQFNRDDTHW